MGSVGEAAPPEAITLIWVAPRRSWSRAALRTSSGPSQMMKPAMRPPMPRSIASITVASRSGFSAPAGAIRAMRPSAMRTETPGRGSAPVPSMSVVLCMRRVMGRLYGLSALRDPKCYARKLLGQLPELARNRLVAGGGAGAGGLWIAARLEEAAGADKCTAGQRGIGRRVQDRQGPHLGALGKDPVADRHERAVRHRG